MFTRYKTCQFLTTLLAAMLISTVAHAGPPLLCHQVDIGEAKSLPWGGGAFDQAKNYDAAAVVNDTLKLLTPEMPVLVRMETLRRATVYIGQDSAKADRLLGSLLTRTLDAEVVMEAKVLALRYFDAGYFASILQQAGVKTSFGPKAGKGALHSEVPGYAWAVRAYKMAETDRDMALALALMTADTRMSEHNMFLEQAVKACAADDAPRIDLLGWIAQVRGTTLEAIRAKTASASVRD